MSEEDRLKDIEEELKELLEEEPETPKGLIDPVIDTISIALYWVVLIFRHISGYFYMIADYARDIPIIGVVIALPFTWVADFFYTVADWINTFRLAVKSVLITIDSFLVRVAQLWYDIYNWIIDKVNDAYEWALQAIELIQDVWADINMLITQVFYSIPQKFSALWDRIYELLDQVFTYIPEKFSSVWDQINTLLTEVFTSIPDKFSSFWDQINTIVTELSTSIIDRFSSLWDVMWVLIKETLYSIPDKFSSVWDKIDLLITAVFTSIPEKISSIFDYIANLGALIKGEVLQVIGPVFNLVSFFFEDISNFFSDPADYFDKKVDQLGSPFAERLWAVVEKILERIW